MLSLSRKTDYALLILTSLADSRGEYVSLRKLADDLQIPYRFASAVMKPLVEKEVVESKEGAGGGYRLMKPPSRITVRDVVVMEEGGVAMASCLDSEKRFTCARKHECAARRGISAVQRIVLDALASRTIADIAREGRRT
jgi:Rrf2 family protein